jgi:hypothetical protein
VHQWRRRGWRRRRRVRHVRRRHRTPRVVELAWCARDKKKRAERPIGQSSSI